MSQWSEAQILGGLRGHMEYFRELGKMDEHMRAMRMMSILQVVRMLIHRGADIDEILHKINDVVGDFGETIKRPVIELEVRKYEEGGWSNYGYSR